jgi:hypothetical protein
MKRLMKEDDCIMVHLYYLDCSSRRANISELYSYINGERKPRGPDRSARDVESLRDSAI